MATIILTTDTLISTIMPSGGGSLASGDTIQLAGHSLIVDADAVDYPVTIANSGAKANLELRDLGRIKLNASLPATVYPWIDPAHPLPVSAEPGIDGDPYRTPLTANARVEIQLNGNFGLGGGAASLPTETRKGSPWFMVLYVSGNTIAIDRDANLHKGDYVFFPLGGGKDYRIVEDYDAANLIVTLSSAADSSAAGKGAHVLAGGVVLFFMYDGGASSSLVSILTANIACGTFCILQIKRSGGYSRLVADSIAITGKRFISATIVTGSSDGDYGTIFALNSTVCVDFLAAQKFFNYWIFGQLASQVSQKREPLYISAGEFYLLNISDDSGKTTNEHIPLHLDLGAKSGGYIHAIDVWPRNSNYTLHNAVLTAALPAPIFGKTYVRLENSTVAGTPVDDIIEAAGVVSVSNGAWLHAPATAADVTWRYTDRTVPPGATLRLRCAWLREGSAATRASVAVTDPATWWPSLWPLGADALASVEFTGGTSDWRQQLLTWRNTSSEAVQVRVWECVTGTVAGGYLRVEEVKGGQL